MKKVLLFILTFVFLTSCSITNRKYMSGYYLDWGGTRKIAKTNQISTPSYCSPTSMVLKNATLIIAINRHKILQIPNEKKWVRLKRAQGHPKVNFSETDTYIQNSIVSQKNSEPDRSNSVQTMKESWLCLLFGILSFLCIIIADFTVGFLILLILSLLLELFFAVLAFITAHKVHVAGVHNVIVTMGIIFAIIGILIPLYVSALLLISLFQH